MSYVFEPAPIVAIPVVGSESQFPVRRIYCVGRNYVEHAQEMGFTGRELPFFFGKPADAIITGAPGETVTMDYPSKTQNLHFEAELVVAIGLGGKDIPAADALRHIWGYGVGLDMTRRDLQNEQKKQGRPWEVGKAFEQSAPIAALHPIVDTGEITQGDVWLTVNGETRQKSDLSKLIWSVAEVIEHLSGLFTLQPGDLIFTGTPEGVGAVKPGDLIEVGVASLTRLSVQVR
ncbi:fumarylacetoacetate hydrolase family protein [Pigmentiphaga aceris]|uniref:Fumarylacetoacetate hydrolase family protein n=1 Tax=Pigmentiphaga aceris TaxID=1940612 RepID=A0A5C0B2F3_9BURK|nr:fumarylacetoacetate hydrolase family protein [Pigmentiphaga aceris]QEI08096.1 fumarylacetoacetate hydrolase family protein [Pigmentiphaga aceris]